MVGKVKKYVGKSKWKDEWYVQAYELAKAGASNKRIAQVLGVDIMVFKNYMRKRPALVEALEKARGASGEKGKERQTFKEFVYGRLPEHLQKLWKDINTLDGAEEGDETDYAARKKKRDAALAAVNNPKNVHGAEGKRWKQHMFLYALVHCDFSMTEACKKLDIPRPLVDKWAHSSEDFAELLAGIHQCKKDFFESALIGLVKKQDTAAILFANRTINRDRGYNDKVQVDVSVRGGIDHRLTVEDLETLPLESRKQLLEVFQRKRTMLLGHDKNTEVIDAEFQETEEKA